MSPADLPILADTFLQSNRHWLVAVLSVVVALVVAGIVDHVLARRTQRLELGAVTDTRLRILRRLVYTVIVVLGIATALSQFTALDRLAASVLASGAIAAAVIGFAARQTLANAVAGILLAITQPLRIGDRVTFEDETGIVEDVRLTYTYLRTAGDVRIVIPNERLAAGVLRNESIVSATVGVETSIWTNADIDETRALEVLGEGATIAETTPEGVRFTLSGDPVNPSERPGREAALRAEGLRALREAGLR